MSSVPSWGTLNWQVAEKAVAQERTGKQRGQSTKQCLLFAGGATEPHIVPVVAARLTDGIITDYDLSVHGYVNAHSTSTTPVANLDVGRRTVDDRDGNHTWVIVGTGKARGYEKMNSLMAKYTDSLIYGDVLVIKTTTVACEVLDIQSGDIEEAVNVLITSVPQAKQAAGGASRQ